MTLEDAPMATLLVVEERMLDEVRRTYYVRRDADVPAHLTNFLPTYRIAMVQGELWRR